MAEDPNTVTPKIWTEDPPGIETPRSDNPGAIRARIEATRQDLGETIDAIQDRLSPQHLMTQAKEAAKEAAVNRVKSAARKAGDTASELAYQTSETAAGFGRIVSDHPVSAALLGVAAGLLVSKMQNRPVRSDPAWAADYPSREWLTEAPDFGQERGGMADTFKQAPLWIAAGLGLAYWSLRNRETSWQRSPYASLDSPGSVERTRQAVANAAARARDTVAEASSRAQDAVVETSQRVVRRAGGLSSEAQTAVKRMMDTSPLSLAGIAFAVGAAVGAAFPSSETEQEWMGETRDRMMGQAREKVREVKDTIKEKVQETAEQVQKAAGDVTNNL